MKLYGILTAAAIILPAFASCNKEISESGPVDKIRLEPIYLSTSDTKTSVNGNEIWWTLSDQIAVFSNIGDYHTPYSLSAVSVEGSNAVFAGKVGEGTTDFYAIYPYSVAGSAVNDSFYADCFSGRSGSGNCPGKMGADNQAVTA